MKKKIINFSNSIYSTHLIVIGIFLSVFMLNLFFIWTHDDYTTVGIYSFKEAFEKSLYFGNGRFLGNLFVDFIMCRSIIDKIVRTVVISSIIITSATIIDGYRKRSLILSFLLYIGVGNEIFKQTYVWGHGFYNYAPPVLFLLLSILLLKKIYSSNNSKSTILCYITLVVCGVSQQLFAENSSTINCLIALIILVYVIYTKKEKLASVVNFISASVGAGIMFLVPEILDVADKMNEYRGGLNSIKDYAINGVRNALTMINVLSSQIVIFEVIAILLIAMLVKKNLIKGKVHIILLSVYLVANPIFIYFRISSGMLFRAIYAALFILYLIVISVSLIKLEAIKEKKVIIVLAAIAVLSLGQLLIVTPIGPRCMFITYALMVSIVLILQKYVFEKLESNTVNKLKGIVISFSVVVYTCILITFISISKLNDIRIDYVQKQLSQGKTTIELIRIPNEQWVHLPNELYAYKYTFNQGDSKEMNFTLIDYEEYLAKEK